MGKLGTMTPPSRERTMTPQTTSLHNPAPTLDYRRADHIKAAVQQEAGDAVTVPHNEYPSDGMTMFCRSDQPSSERSSAVSALRPSSRDSHSECSQLTSLSSIDPVSGQQSPSRLESSTVSSTTSPGKQIQKKRSGFFSNSPFRRKSKHEKERPSIPTPRSHNTWGPENSRSHGTNGLNPGRRSDRESHSGSPEPADPRASFQLNVGQNVFDVASPDTARQQSSPRKMMSPSKDLDPIAAALEELKGVNKQSSVRMSADRYAGVATPAPPSMSSMSQGEAAAAHRPTPPPSYNSDQNIRRLDAPQPAFTASQMRQTTQKYVGQNQEIFGNSRPTNRGHGGDLPRATSPRPMRSISPRPGYQPSREPGLPRAASPNPYGNGGRPRQTPNSSPTKQTYSRHTSPNGVGRSPPGRSTYPRADRPGSGNGMEMQLADGGRSSGQHARGSNGRPASYYGGQPQGPDPNGGRVRSKSMANGRQFTQDGRPILQFGECAHQDISHPLISFQIILMPCALNFVSLALTTLFSSARAMYLYRAAIPEELSFAKGDILAVLRLQDDGWWEAEVTGKPGGRGLVPSNYLQPVAG